MSTLWIGTLDNESVRSKHSIGAHFRLVLGMASCPRPFRIEEHLDELICVMIDFVGQSVSEKILEFDYSTEEAS